MSWENFSRDEFACTHCGENEINDDLIDVLQEIRTAVNFPLVITSGYRCSDHPVERSKPRPGTHNLGLAADISVAYAAAYRVIEAAMATGRITGLGVNQKGEGRFIHLDIAPNSMYRARPAVWSY